MVKVKGTTPAEKKVVAAARKAARKPVRRTTRADETAEAKTTLPAKRKAAADQFAKADEAVVAADSENKGAETRLRMAALGGL